MIVLYHPEFPRDIKKFQLQYLAISARLGLRFRSEVDSAIEHVKDSPGSGHFLNTGSLVVKEVRRRNLRSFPFFVLYAVAGERLIFRALIPSMSDPLVWLKRMS